MDEDAVFRRYDIRGKVPEEIDGEFAERLGKAIGTFSRERFTGKVVVGRDNKQSSRELERQLKKGLRDTGATVLEAGEGPTDYTGFTGMRNEAVSVHVTSSHLPLEFNGFKLMYPEGNGFLNPDLDRIEELFRNQNFKRGASNTVNISSTEDYRQAIKQFFHGYFEAIDRKIVVETMGGATTSILPDLLEELGAEVVDIASERKAETPYIDPPDPRPENLSHVEERVKEENADLGLALDMDGDRISVYYSGKWLDGNQVFGLLSTIINAETAVASIDTSKAMEQIIGEVDYTRVGDPFVLDRFLELGADIAGEPNGHYCFKGFVPYNSGSLSAALLSGAELEELLSRMPERAVSRRNVEVNSKEEKLEAVRKSVREEFDVLSELDGIKYSSGDAEILVRSSGSSQKLRIVAESGSGGSAEEALERAVELVRNA